MSAGWSVWHSFMLGIVGASAFISGLVVFHGDRFGFVPSRPEEVAREPTAIPGAMLEPRFRRCAHCHQIGEGARHMAGPVLNGLFGRVAGSIEGYPASAAMRTSGIVWDEATLDRFIAAPGQVVPGTRMVFTGIEDGTERREIVGILVRLSADGTLHQHQGEAR